MASMICGACARTAAWAKPVVSTVSAVTASGVSSAETVIIKDGSKGAYVQTADENYDVAGYKVEKVVDTVGAGDGFAVGVLSGILEGLDLKDSVKRGNAIGAIQVMNIGDNEGLPTPKELKAFQENN